jgi:hypothetical protein
LVVHIKEIFVMVKAKTLPHIDRFRFIEAVHGQKQNGGVNKE